MNTSILGDRIIVLWQVFAFGCILGVVLIVLPRFIERIYRRRGVEPPSRARRIMACAFVVVITVFIAAIVSYVFLAILISTFYESAEWLISPAALLLWIGSSVATSILVMRLFLSKSAKDQQKILLLPALVMALCVIGFHACAMSSLGRVKTLCIRSKDSSNLNHIGKGFFMYHDDYGVYPDDLRRLVDVKVVARKTLVATSTLGSDFEGFSTSSETGYQGPCDFVYIRLPEDAPGDLVWIWQPVEYNDNEGGCVLFKDNRVRWMRTVPLIAELARTYKWLGAHPTTQPATQPAEQQ